MGHDWYVDIAVPLRSVCINTNFKNFLFCMTSLNHAYCLGVFDRCMGDVYVSRFREFSQ